MAISSSDEAILVTTPHLASLRDADKTAAMLRGAGLKRIKLVVNKVRGDLVAGGLSLSPEAIESALKIPLLGVIPSDDEAFCATRGKFLPIREVLRRLRCLRRILQTTSVNLRLSVGLSRFCGIYKKEIEKRIMRKDEARLKRIIEGDRMNFSVNGQELIAKDLAGVLSDYFHLTDKPTLTVTGGKRGYEIRLEASADAIKAFKVLP